MRAIAATLRGMLRADTSSFSDEDRLSLAASLEFYALDPVFARLVEESDPTAGRRRHDAYEEHVALLATAMESRRSWVLAPHIALLHNVVGSPANGSALDHHDPATGLPLRLVAEQAIDDLCASPGRSGEPISFALLEILGLQSAFDHDQGLGERTLLRLVSVVTSLLRMTDLLVRPEGNRLAIVLPSTSSASAATTMKAIGQAVAHEGASATCGGDPLGMVASVVTLPPSAERCGAHEAFSAAEEQLSQLLATGGSLGVVELA
jgi:GGDEF domain-containing protein